jgi:tetraacyldisaccharide 4'-kinase
MTIQPLAWRHILSQVTSPLKDNVFKLPIHAVAGIGNPERFFKTLDSLSLHYYAHHFSDHYKFSSKDFEAYQNDIVVMTEKDAVKCGGFAKKDWYSLIVGAQLNDIFWKEFQHKLNSLTDTESTNRF